MIGCYQSLKKELYFSICKPEKHILLTKETLESNQQYEAVGLAEKDGNILLSLQVHFSGVK